MARVSVFGLGYVGCVSAACLARQGHDVLGVDVSAAKVDMIRSGRSTILEEGIADLVAESVGSGRLRGTTNVQEAVDATDLSFVCVGTPSMPNGGLDLQYVERVCTNIGKALRGRTRPHTVVIRSTVLPGTIHELAGPALREAAGGAPVTIAANPEFLREGTSIRDFFNPPFTLIGADEPETFGRVRALYEGIEAPVHEVPVPVAEMVKYACNAFHGMKVAFANEIGTVAKAMGIDSHAVMQVFCEDHKLNISPAYLKPGFAFGGSCLPKDLRALTYRARQLDVDVPLLAATLESNRLHIERAIGMVLDAHPRHVGVLGLSFKPGTDDLRESPLVTVIERLIGKGVPITVYDRDVSESQVFGANRAYVEREIPHIWHVMNGSLEAVLAESDVIVVGKPSSEYADLAERPGRHFRVIDFARLAGAEHGQPDGYSGICW